MNFFKVTTKIFSFLYSDMQFLENIPDFRNSKSATLDIFAFVDDLSMFLKKREAIFPFFWNKTSAVVACLFIAVSKR